MRCSAAASSRCAFGAFLHDPLLGLHRRHELGLDAAVELGPIFFGDVGCGPNDVLSQTQSIERGFGKALVEQRPCTLDALLDIVGQLLAGDVLGRLALLDRGSVGRGSGGRRRRPAPRRPGLDRAWDPETRP